MREEKRRNKRWAQGGEGGRRKKRVKIRGGRGREIANRRRAEEMKKKTKNGDTTQDGSLTGTADNTTITTTTTLTTTITEHAIPVEREHHRLKRHLSTKCFKCTEKRQTIKRCIPIPSLPWWYVYEVLLYIFFIHYLCAEICGRI